MGGRDEPFVVLALPWNSPFSLAYHSAAVSRKGDRGGRLVGGLVGTAAGELRLGGFDCILG